MFVDNITVMLGIVSTQSTLKNRHDLFTFIYIYKQEVQDFVSATKGRMQLQGAGIWRDTAGT